MRQLGLSGFWKNDVVEVVECSLKIRLGIQREEEDC